MMRIARILIVAALAALAVSCNREPVPGAGSMEFTGICAGLPSASETKATTYTPYVGRGIENANSRYLEFENGDEIIITKMARTADPIPSLSYSGFGYSKTDGVWSRSAGATGNSAPTKLYWSDSVHPHTFVGYSLPSSDFQFSTSDSPARPESVYSGSIQYVAGTPNVADLSDNDKIKSQDLLLLYNTEQRAGDTGEATLVFHHALACVRVIIDIVDYSSQDLDRKTKVDSLVLADMPVEYTWDQLSDGVTVKPLSRKADFKTWHPNPAVNTFFCVAVPGVTDMVMKFDVITPDPLYPDDPNKTSTHTYSAQLIGSDAVTLYAGKCTTLNVHLSHDGEEITIGASYQDWEFIDTPDVGALKKNVTFIYTNGGKENPIDKVTIAGDSGATEDDATWLYISGEKLYDIYLNDGTQENPFKIATANQLVSFAKEVKSGRTFKGQYIVLDASLTLQEVKGETKYTWPMIGSAGNPFQGTFLGGGRTISKINGNPLFYEIGSNATVENLALLECVSSGTALAQTNAGKICAVRVEGSAQYAVDNNTGNIFASSITGGSAKAMVKGSSDGKDGGPATGIIASFCGGATGGYLYEKDSNPVATSKHKSEMISQPFVDVLNAAISGSTDAHKNQHIFKFQAGNYPVISDVAPVPPVTPDPDPTPDPQP